MAQDASRVVGHLKVIGPTLWMSFIISKYLGVSLLEKILVGSGFMLVVLIPGYAIRWWVQRRRRADQNEDEATTPPYASSAWDLIAVAGLGVPAAGINLLCRLCHEAAEYPRGVSHAQVAIEAAETFALLWALAAVCWCCILAYQALRRDWRAVAAAAGAVVLAAATGLINLAWLWR